MRNHLGEARMRARINAVRQQGNLYSPGGDVIAKRAAIQELKRMGFPTLSPEEIRKHKFKVKTTKN